MQKTYHSQAIEHALYQTWEQQHCFQATGKGESYSIVLPPPNVTGSLHMGHGFQDVIMDCLIRYHRMSGHNTLWQPGTDHAGIATQMVVERQLQAEGKNRYDLGREDFVKRVWDWKDTSGGKIAQQMRRLGSSCDWTREQFSMDPQIAHATQQAFIRLYNDGLIYRGKRLVNWDPVLKTALSDLEVIATEEKGHLWHFLYPLADSTDHIIIATTRPETLLGDTAVAVHPTDERYRHLIGQQIRLPLTERLIPIIADDYVDPEFGSGCVKITPAHDFNDYEMGQRHQLPLLNILNDDATLNTEVPEAYQGLDRFVAREKIVKDLDALGLLEKIEPHTLKIPRGDRGNTIIEPYLSDQWYIQIEPLAKPAIEAVENRRITFAPQGHENMYFAWMRDIQDWCISRQLWWGHRIPAWYDENGHVYVGNSVAEIRAQHQLAESVVLTQDTDVLDTWFTAGLWPFSALGWPDKTPELEQFYSTNTLVTGFDIIFFWVARMIMFGLYFMGDVPFKTVYIHGLIRDQDGQKMSKSKGNVIDPIDLIDGVDLATLIEKRTDSMMQPRLKEKAIKATQRQFPEGIEAYGTDALRFTYCALASTSRDICFDIKRMEGYRNFCNKLWNAARFVLMQCEDQPIAAESVASQHPVDQWIQTRFDQCIIQMHGHIAAYRFDHLAQSLYDFVWNEFCDWYLELSKVTLHTADAEQGARTRRHLLNLLANILRAAHPIIPFITETIWQSLQPYFTDSADTLLIQGPCPQTGTPTADTNLIEDIEWLKRLISAIRTVRSEMNVPPNQSSDLYLHQYSTAQQQRLETHQALVKALLKINTLHFAKTAEEIPPAAVTFVDQLECHLPLAGLIDVAAEQQRLQKQQEKLNADIQRLTQKLDNPNFSAKAPAAVVEKEQQKLALATEELTSLQTQLDKLLATDH